MRGFDYWPERDGESCFLPDKHRSRTKCNAWPSIDSHSTPCLSVEGIGAVLDHFPCIDQSKWNDLRGTQWPDLMWFWYVRVCVWQAGWRGAWGDSITTDLCPCVRRRPSSRSRVLDDAVISAAHTHTHTHTRTLRDCSHLRDWRINSSIANHCYLSSCPPLNVILGWEIGTEHLVTKR